MEYKTFDGLNLLEQFRGDEEILLEMISIFEDNLADLLVPIRKSVINKDAEQLKLYAHTFKGVLGNFYAEKGKELAYKLEVFGEQSNFDHCIDVLNQLENQLHLFIYELNFFKKNLKVD